MATQPSGGIAPPDALEDLSERDWEERLLRYRRLTGVWAAVYSAVAAFLTISHLYTWGFSPRPFATFLPLHLGVMFVIVFFLFPTTRRWETRDPHERSWRHYASRGFAALDFALAVIATYVTGYLYFYSDEIIARSGALSSWDILVGTVGLLLLAEATRRAVGIPMVILSSLFIVYAMYGYQLPIGHPLRTRERDWDILAEQMWFGTGGVFGIPIQVAATYVVVFIALGGFFKYSGVGEFFINLAYSLTGHRRGGPAKTAILGSALMGTVSGSSIGNVVSTGAFTIPMMRRVGYRREFAGAVEASASAGGQIMPPILGAAAFIMVEFLSIPYRDIVIASIIPALAFFAGAWIMVHLEAKKRGLRSVPKSQLPDWKLLLKRQWYYLTPFFLLFGLLMSERVSLFRAGMYVIVLTYAFLVAQSLRHAGEPPSLRRHGYLLAVPLLAAGAAYAMTRDADDALLAAVLTSVALLAIAGVWHRATWSVFRRLREAFDEVGRNMAGVTMACAAAGVIGGVVTLTGFGGKIVLLVADWSGGSFFIALVLTMLACLVLGMGLPTTATYVVVVTIAAPAIVNFPGFVPPNGLSKDQWLLAAHMFVLFYGVVADVTPPVSLAAYAAAGIAGGDQMKTGIEAFKISANKFLVPFAFIYQPAILFIGVRWTDPVFLAIMAWDIVLIFVGIFYLHAGLSRFMITHARWWEAVAFAVGGALLMFPTLLTDAIGLGLVGTATLAHRARARRGEGGATPPVPAA